MQNDYNQTSMLDIVFEYRNKSYGAYVLRRDHDKSLRTAMAFSFSIVFILITGNFIAEKIRGAHMEHADKEIIANLSDPLVIKKRPLVTAELPKPVEKAQAKPKPTVRNTTIQVITNSDMVRDSIPTVDDFKNTESGITDKRSAVNEGFGVDGGTGTGNSLETGPEAAPANSEPVRIAEIMPEFPGGEAKLLKFLADNTSYPDIERELGLGGKVLAEVTIGLDGHISDVHIIKSPSLGFDREVKRVAKIIPAFKPSMQQGRPVRVKMIIPFTFKSTN